MIPTQEKAEGNDDVIQLLEQALGLAREGRLVSACLVATERDGMMLRAIAGMPGMETQLFFALEKVKDHIKQIVAEREQRVKQTRESADFVCWSLRDMPYSYDFLCAIVSAEMTRIREGAPAPLKFCFHGVALKPTEYSSQFFNNVMVPALKMIGAEIDPRALSGRSLNSSQIKEICQASRAGEKVPKLKASPYALDSLKEYADAVTLTLREAEHWQHRNSNVPEWLKLAEYLSNQGERVVFVRDTARAHEPITGFETHPLAATNLDIRLALYENAKINLFAAGGAFGLALFGTRPFLCFQYLNEDDLYEPNKPSWWRREYGMEPGEQFPWCAPDQRIIQGRDTFEVMKNAWDWLRLAKPVWEQPIIGT